MAAPRYPRTDPIPQAPDGRPASWQIGPEILQAIWHETARHRASLHRLAGTGRCTARITAATDMRWPVVGECPCRDFLVDMVVAAMRFLDAHPHGLRNPAGAVRTHLRTRCISDSIRAQRLAMGAQARTDRIRTGARAHGLPTDYHRAVLEFAVAEAGSPAPLSGELQLRARIAARCATEFVGTLGSHLHRLELVLDEVAAHCRSGPRVNAGTADEPDFVSWWERYVERPLGRRQPPTEALADGLTPRPTDRQVRAQDAECRWHNWVDSEVVRTMAAEAERARMDRSGDFRWAVQRGIAELVRTGVLDSPAATDMLADSARVTAAARELHALSS